jgi:hypothetical protein
MIFPSRPSPTIRPGESELRLVGSFLLAADSDQKFPSRPTRPALITPIEEMPEGSLLNHQVHKEMRLRFGKAEIVEMADLLAIPDT